MNSKDFEDGLNQIKAMIEKISNDRDITNEYRRKLVAGLIGQLVHCARQEDKSILEEAAENLSRM